jgi:hypothetical protein
VRCLQVLSLDPLPSLPNGRRTLWFIFNPVMLTRALACSRFRCAIPKWQL